MSEEPGGFELGSAYVQVSPDTGTFAEQLEGELGELNYVVTVPVVADTAGLAEQVQADADAAKAEVAVPVVPDTEGFQLLIDDAVEQAKAEVTVPVVPDTAGLPEEIAEQADAAKAEVTVPVVADTAGLAEETEAAAGAAGEAAGATFSEKFTAAAEGANLFPAAGIERDAEAAGEESASGFGARFSSMLAGIPLLGGLMGGAEEEAAAGGAAVGESFMGKFKGVISGDLPILETLLGAAFVAATADMASKFQAAMELIHTQAGVAQSAISGLSTGVLTLAGKVGESPDSLAAALYHVESSFQSVGISGSKALQLVQIAAEGARTGNADLVDVTNALDATIVSGVGGVKNYSQAMGALNAIVGTGDMTMQNLADAMGTGLMAAGKAYGQSIYQIGAALATFGDNNIRGAKAATDLRMAWQAIEAPLKTGIGTLNSLGLTQDQLASEMTQHGLTAALQMFVSHLEASKIPVSQWGEYVTEIFGKRAGVGLQVLMDQLSRLQGKLPDIEKGAHDFGNAWASTQATTSQKLKELEAGFEALMIKIGDGLLPAVNSFLGMIVRNLPAIEHFGTEVAHLVAPAATAFFTGLHAILKELFGPLRAVTIAVAGLGAALLAISTMTPVGWTVLGIAALAELVGLIIKYHQEILDTIHKYWHDIEIFLAGLAVFFPVEAALAALVAVVVKYHAQIFDAIKDAWHAVLAFFDSIRDAITGGFDQWWASHGKEVVQVWTDTWKTVSAVWDQAWSDLMAAIQPDLDLLEAVFKTTWDAITAVFKDAWDVIAAALKVALSGVEASLKIAWDLITGVFSVFLDLITGKWGQAWKDIESTGEQIWNAIKTEAGTVWKAISDLITQLVNNLKGFLGQAWNAIRTGVISAFTDMWHGIVTIWDNILSDITTVVNKIKSVISSVTSLPGKVLSGAASLLSHVPGLAGGGVIPGYAPGKDSVRALLSPGEAVLVPEAVRAIGPDKIHAINRAYSGHRAAGAFGGIVTGYSGGGIVPSVVPDAVGAYAMAGAVAGLMRILSGAPGGTAALGTLAGTGTGIPQPYSYGGQQTQADGRVINFNYYGPQNPTAEMRHAMMMELSTAIGNS